MIRAGDVIDGKYRVERAIAEGGLGHVYLAKQLGLDRYVAIKHLRPEALEDATVVDRFEREARLAARIASEHVVRIHDVGKTSALGPYIVMEYLEGEDLEALLQRGTLPIDDAIDYVLQVCDALVDAHALRIVHRDLKPANLYLASREGRPPILKVIDFGSSRFIDAPSGHLDFATPAYAAPEVLCADAAVDARADVWALAVVLHEMLAGDMPFAGETELELTERILHDPPIAIRTIREDVPEDIEAIILRCLEKAPARRIGSVAELARRL